MDESDSSSSAAGGGGGGQPLFSEDRNTNADPPASLIGVPSTPLKRARKPIPPAPTPTAAATATATAAATASASAAPAPAPVGTTPAAIALNAGGGGGGGRTEKYYSGLFRGILRMSDQTGVCDVMRFKIGNEQAKDSLRAQFMAHLTSDSEKRHLIRAATPLPPPAPTHSQPTPAPPPPPPPPQPTHTASVAGSGMVPLVPTVATAVKTEFALPPLPTAAY